MARKTSNPFDTYRRLSPTELQRLGFSKTSRRYVRKTTKNLTKSTVTIPYRQYEQKRILVETGERITLERKARQLSSGERSYRSESIRRISLFKKDAREIRADVTGVTLKDIKLILKFRDEGYHGLSGEDGRWDDFVYDYETDKEEHSEKYYFRQLFTKYHRSQVLPALGSPVVMKRGLAA